MHNCHETTINSSWYAGDLDYFESGSEFKILSVHKDVINLISDRYPRLLIIAQEGPVKGPSTIGLTDPDFLYLGKLISENDCFCLERNKLSITGNTGKISVNVSCGEKISFNVANHIKTKPVILSDNHQFCKEILKRWPSPSASAVLVDLPGGEDYFRNELLINYPHLVDSLLKSDEEDFLKRCRKIIGMGRGLTPTGDDLIHGTLVTFRYLRPSFKLENKTVEKLLNLCKDTTRQGRHMIDLGYRGLTIQPVIELLKYLAVVNGSRGNIYGLLNIGSSTGFDLAVAAIYSTGQISNYDARCMDI